MEKLAKQKAKPSKNINKIS